jgi:hypothetical protein
MLLASKLIREAGWGAIVARREVGVAIGGPTVGIINICPECLYSV